MNTAALAETTELLEGAAPPAPVFRVRRLLSFMGPGYLIAVGYMDPGNWATSLAGGSRFGYSLLSVLLVANAMAMLLQAASVRLGMASGLDLAQACRQQFGPLTNWCLWAGCEIAIVACNLAEILGMACGLNLLFHMPLTLGVCLTGLDVMLILFLARRGVRCLEAIIIALITLIGACFLVQLWWLKPSAAAIVSGFAPSPSLFGNSAMLYLAIGILGATVMPHNLYLHSSIVQSRRHDGSAAGVRQAIRYATVDSNSALTLALLVNVGIMVLAAGAFYGKAPGPSVDLATAYRLLSPLLGNRAASTLFGVGLIAAGLSSSITGTLAGQVVMEGFLELRVPRMRRALITRALALIPAIGVAAAFGGAGMGKLLVSSQFVLGLQLPFAVIPLLWFTTRPRFMGQHAFRPATSALLWATAAVVVFVNVLWIYSLF